MNRTCLSLAVFFFSYLAQAQVWKGKSCAVVLTYDDAIDVDLDNVVPALDSAGLRGTFYLIGSSPVITKRMDEWRAAAAEGHELGNHSFFHPCDASIPGRSWVTPENDLSHYTVTRAVNEIRACNTLLSAIDGKRVRTFAYPCGDMTINGTPFYDHLQKDFAGARGVTGAMDAIDKVNLNNIDAYAIDGQQGDYMIDLVKKAMKTQSLLVFLFHGVGGGHNINVSLEAHRELLHFLKENEGHIWVAPMVEVAQYVRKYRKDHHVKK